MDNRILFKHMKTKNLQWLWKNVGDECKNVFIAKFLPLSFSMCLNLYGGHFYIRY